MSIKMHSFDLFGAKKLGEQSYYLPYGEIFLKIKRDKKPALCLREKHRRLTP